jgi:gas vesicle protein
MKGILSFMKGLIWGGVAGAAAAILFAPASGEETQMRLRRRADNIREEVNQAAAARRAELEQQLAMLRSKES